MSYHEDKSREWNEGYAALDGLVTRQSDQIQKLLNAFQIAAQETRDLCMYNPYVKSSTLLDSMKILSSFGRNIE